MSKSERRLWTTPWEPRTVACACCTYQLPINMSNRSERQSDNTCCQYAHCTYATHEVHCAIGLTQAEPLRGSQDNRGNMTWQTHVKSRVCIACPLLTWHRINNQSVVRTSLAYIFPCVPLLSMDEPPPGDRRPDLQEEPGTAEGNDAPKQRYPRSRVRDDGTRRRTRNEVMGRAPPGDRTPAPLTQGVATETMLVIEIGNRAGHIEVAHVTITSTGTGAATMISGGLNPTGARRMTGGAKLGGGKSNNMITLKAATHQGRRRQVIMSKSQQRRQTERTRKAIWSQSAGSTKGVPEQQRRRKLGSQQREPTGPPTTKGRDSPKVAGMDPTTAAATRPPCRWSGRTVGGPHSTWPLWKQAHPPPQES